MKLNILKISLLSFVLLLSTSMFAFDFNSSGSDSHNVTGDAPSDYHQGKAGASSTAPSSLTYSQYQYYLNDPTNTDDDITPGGTEDGGNDYVGSIPVGDGIIPTLLAVMMYGGFVLLKKRRSLKA